MSSIKLPFTSEMRGGSKNSSFKIMTTEQLDKKINKYIKSKLKSGSLINYIKDVFYKTNKKSKLKKMNNSNSNSNSNSKSINYIKASKTKEYYKKLSKK
jgi:hypothetical protein